MRAPERSHEHEADACEWPLHRIHRTIGPMRVAVLAVALLFAGCQTHASAPTHAARFPGRLDPRLPARERFFPKTDHTAVRISPDGKSIGYIGVTNDTTAIFVGPTSDISQAKPIQLEQHGQLEGWTFAYAPNWLIYILDPEGREESRVYAVDLTSGQTTDLTPDGTKGVVSIRLSKRRLYEVALVAKRAPEGEIEDVWTTHLRSGQSQVVFANDDQFVDFDLDDELRVKVASRLTPVDERELCTVKPEQSFPVLVRAESADALTTSSVGVDASGSTLYALDSRGRNTSALVAIDLATGEKRVLAADDRADVVSVLRDDDGRPQAVTVDPGKREWRAIDPGLADDLAAISSPDRVFDIVSRSSDDKTWILFESAPDWPGTWSIYDRATKQKKKLFAEASNDILFAATEVVQIHTRDGLDLVGYLTRPPGLSPHPSPMVLFVHGGPWSRDRWEPSYIQQLLVSRGYAVLTVNFRGSTGFGKKLLNAGDREWGGKMQDDLVDAVGWAVARGVADPTRVAIVGASYGGFAALTGLTRDAKTFACGVDFAGPSNLVTFVENIPPNWHAMVGQFHARVGDWTAPAGRRDLLAHSPLTHASDVRAPLLIVQGTNDPRVKETESAQMAKAVQQNGGTVTYLRYEDEGHGFSDKHNRRSLAAIMEVFLSRCIGGSYEDLGDALVGSSVDVVVGGEHIPGLAAASLR